MAELDGATPEYRAKLTAQFLASEAWTHAVQAVETRIMQEWAKPQTPPERREALWQKFQAFQDVKRELRILRDRGKLAETTEE